MNAPDGASKSELTLFIVTVKVAKDPDHNPRAKVTAPCPLSNRECTDQTGEHHSSLMLAPDGVALRRYFDDLGVHVTRIEEVASDRAIDTVWV